jgi:hypothetical protein
MAKTRNRTGESIIFVGIALRDAGDAVRIVESWLDGQTMRSIARDWTTSPRGIRTLVGMACGIEFGHGGAHSKRSAEIRRLARGRFDDRRERFMAAVDEMRGLKCPLRRGVVERELKDAVGAESL